MSQVSYSNVSAPELGVYGAYANKFGEFEVILTTDLACAAHVVFVTADNRDICIIHASDCVRSPLILSLIYSLVF